MARKAGRTPEETRRALLNAASAVIRTRGISASLDEIARAAGVSKGGLLYHFATKDDLVRALAEDLMESFRADVVAAVDPADQAPGRLTRAYIRVSLAGQHDETAVRESVALVTQLHNWPEIVDLARADARRWTEDLRADGLPDHVLSLVIAAADGASATPLWGGAIPEGAAHLLERQLLRLTRDQRLWQHLELDPAAG
ncbi:TetR/AcrR family transcriptional regulator [Goodfellowiella coeruleoviolacea]|uniref:Transcriptional regulator, TetR family n=1 Tax=Goodfellowiella coeruleoviolacea TaxID=334858 RepID=A0AAE3GIJ8_9PSEU|nr:TetR/AcrR family transcriptional regulator [Goodfellowiella coeruleoviolacea]MCP2168856.1 transcriptional regulator, TetR family [Goodfellowiella coeruleoviolacea]